MSNNTKTYPLNQSPLFRLRRKKRLCELLRISETELKTLTRNQAKLYSEFEVQRKDGRSRGVENPRRDLKLLQARLARMLGRITPPDYLFCPVKGRSYVSNAHRHIGQRTIHCLDIRKYFPSTPSRRVYWFFHSVMECEKDIAAILALLATYKGHLPTGSPLSPILAFFAHFDVWQNVAAICKRHDYRLTVYIDDVTISGSRLSPQVIFEIKKAIHRSGLRYHKEKHYVGRPAEVTGVIVDGTELLPPNRHLKRVVDTRRQLERDLSPLLAEALTNRLTGRRGTLAQIFNHDARPTTHSE